MTRLLALGCAIAVVAGGLTVAAAPAADGAPAPSPHVRELCPKPAHPGTASCSAAVRTDVTSHLGVTPKDAPAGYGPADLRAAYQLPESTSSPTIAVIAAFDDPQAEADLAVYRQQYGLPECSAANGCFARVDQRGGTTYPESNDYWAAVISMDLDLAGAVCPSCHLLLVESDSTQTQDLGAGLNTAVGLGATSVVDAAIGFEEPDESTFDQAYFNHPGVAITAPSGDYGYSNGTGVPYPGVSPYVTAVGGTSLTRDPGSQRGWDETAWSQAGSGCSAYEPKPAFQHDGGCSGTTAADVSAVADPQNGVAVYNSYEAGGWSVMGGTSGAAAIVAGIYALAGPVTGQPKAYPYAATAALTDVTSGSTGFCDGSYLCTAGPGYDAPTGLGTPRGVLAFESPDRHGDVTGTVTDAATGKALAGASVAADGTTVSTDAQGHYDLPLAVGSHDVTATAFGHDPKTSSAVSVRAQTSTTQDFALSATPSVSLTGTVTDASGHGWPVYAKISVRGMPGGTFFSDPDTGHYDISVPRGRDETLDVDPVYAGYQPVTRTVQIGASDTTADLGVAVDPATCTAPGYAYHYDGLYEPFDATSAPSGWTVRDDNGSGHVWRFDDAGHRGNHTGGTGTFASIDGEFEGIQDAKDTELVSPPTDLSGIASPTVGFSTDFNDLGSSATADVDVSLDGGTTWQNIWRRTSSLNGPRVVVLGLPQAAGHSDVRVRFHYTGVWDYWWQVDDVFLGARACTATPGGLVVGRVTDQNTGDALVGATVTGARSATTVTTPDDPGLGDGLYWMFSPAGSQSLVAASGRFYQQGTATVSVSADNATRHDFALAAGRLALSATALQSTQILGANVTKKVTIDNTGSAPATVNLGEQPSGFQLLAAREAAPPQRVTGSYSPLRTGTAGGASPAAAPDAVPWQPVTSYPTPIMDNSAAYGDGTVYSVGGITSPGQVVADAYAYAPATQAWTAIAPMPHARQKPAVAFVHGHLYAIGGWDETGATIPQTDVYDPETDTWSAGRAVPAAYAGAGVGVAGDKIYVVGGCTTDCGTTDAFAYDPSTDTWATVAPYPKPVAWDSCGGIGATLYCTGGIYSSTSYTSTYAYDPATNHWSQVADLPIDLWGSGYATVGDQFVVSGGITQYSHVLTNQSFGYDPKTDTWTTLPDSIYPTYRGGSACGFYKIGGTAGYFSPVPNTELLPGMDECGGATDVPWVAESPSHFTVAPGASVTVSVTFDAAAADVTQPGTLSGSLAVGEDTPYDVRDIALTMNVTPPKRWGKISGLVTGVNCDGSVAPLPGAVVQVDSWAGNVSLVTDASGHYGYWLDSRSNPLTLIATADSWRPQTRTVRLKAGQTTTSDFALQTTRTCH